MIHRRMALKDDTKRVAITGMAVNTRLGDTLEGFYKNLLAGQSGLTNWQSVDASSIYSKVGGDLIAYDIKGKMKALGEKVPADMYKRMRKILRKAPFSTSLSVLVAVDAMLHAGLIDYDELDPTRMALIVGGHNLNKLYQHNNYKQFQEEPDYIDSMAAFLSLDTDHAGSVGEVLGVTGPIYTMGGACASSNIGLRNAVDEVLYHDNDVAIVVGAALEFAPMDLHAMALMGAISFQNFHDTPEKASRPYDTIREGFIPSHGAAVLIIETVEHAKRRGAEIHAEVLGVSAMSDANHLPSPSIDGQSRTMARVLRRTGIPAEEIDFLSAHATSTPLGDITELRSIKKAFGKHAYNLKINAPKSMLGHTCWSAPAVETVAAVMQMKGGWLHPSINIDNLDPEVDLDVCANKKVEHQINYMLKNSFGFGGINCCSLLKRYDD